MSSAAASRTGETSAIATVSFMSYGRTDKSDILALIATTMAETAERETAMWRAIIVQLDGWWSYGWGDDVAKQFGVSRATFYRRLAARRTDIAELDAAAERERLT